jgi:hypothetical protein
MGSLLTVGIEDYITFQQSVVAALNAVKKNNENGEYD